MGRVIHHIRQTKKGCLGAVAAMIVGKGLDDVNRFCGHDGSKTNFKGGIIEGYLHLNGYYMGCIDPISSWYCVNSEVGRLEKRTDFAAIVNEDGSRKTSDFFERHYFATIVDLEGNPDNPPGSTHAVLLYGGDVYDPLLREKGSVSDRGVVSCQHVYKDTYIETHVIRSK